MNGENARGSQAMGRNPNVGHVSILRGRVTFKTIHFVKYNMQLIQVISRGG